MELPSFVANLFSVVKNQILQTASALGTTSTEKNKILYKLYDKASIYCRDLNTCDFSLLHEQLEILFKELTTWGTTQAIPTLSLETFLQRIKNEENKKLQIVFFDRGKRLLESLLLNLRDKKINLEHRTEVLATLLASDGLEQCVDNCQLLFEHAVIKLEYLANTKLYFSGLVRDYITQLTMDVANSKEIPLPHSFQRVLCDLNDLPHNAYKNVAKNYFLLYAKEAGFPVNVLQDVNALRLQSQLNRQKFNYEQFHTDFLDILKQRFQLSDLIDYISTNYYEKIESLFTTHTDYQQNLDLIVSLLNLIGEDPDFTLHTILNEQGSLSSVDNVKLTVIKRFIQSSYLPKPFQYKINLSNKEYIVQWFITESLLNWVEWQQEDELTHCFFNKLLTVSSETAPLSASIKMTLSLEFAKANPVILHNIFLWFEFASKFYETGNAAINLELTRTFLRFIADADPILVATELKKLSEEKAIALFNNVPDPIKKQFLEKILCRIDFLRRYASIEEWPQLNEKLPRYAKSVSLGYKRITTILTDYVKQFLKKDFDFSKLTFPHTPTVNYLDNLHFNGVNLKGSKFYQSMNGVTFKQANLYGTRFLADLQHITFENCNLINVFFMPNGRLYQSIILLNSPLSLTVAYSLHKAGLESENFFFSSFQLSFVQFDRLLNGFNLEIESFIAQLTQTEIETFLKKLDSSEEWELWQWLKPHLQAKLLVTFLQLEDNLFDVTQADFNSHFDTLIEGFIGLTLNDFIQPLLLSNRMSYSNKIIQGFAKLGLNCLGGNLKKIKRGINPHCLSTKTTEESILPLDYKEHQVMTLLLTKAKPENIPKILQNFSTLASLKQKAVAYRSQRELVFLTDFSHTIDRLLKGQDAYLIPSNQAQGELVSIVVDHHAPIYLSLHRTSNSKLTYIYCSYLHRQHRLVFRDSLLNLPHLLNQYAALLFPDHLTDSVRFQFYKLQSDGESFSALFQKVVNSNFISDREELKLNHDCIHGLSLEQFYRLFLINGKHSVIEQLHSNIIPDAASTLSLSENLFEVIADTNVEQRLQLATLIKTYKIPLAPLVDSQRTESKLRFELNQQIYRNLAASVISNTGLTNEQLIEIVSRVGRSSLLSQFLVKKTETNFSELKQFYQRFSNLNNPLTQGLRLTTFFTPAFFQLLNGDSGNLKFLSTTLIADMTFNQMLNRIITDDHFVQRFPEISNFLRRHENWLAFPIGKGLMIYTFLELNKDLAKFQPNSAEYQITESFLTDNKVMLGMLALEIAGINLGPLGLLIDVAIAVHQLFTLSNYWQTKLPFRVSRFQSIALSLGFYQTWLQEQLQKLFTANGQTAEIERLETLTGLTFSHQLIRIAEITRQEIIIEPPYYIAGGISGNLIKISDGKTQIQYSLHKSTLNIEFTPIRNSVRLENTLINRDKLKQQYPNWIVRATRKTAEGDWFPGSPITITSGQGILLGRDNVTKHSTQAFITSFNPCLGPINLTGGEFIKGKQLYLLVQSLGLAVLPPEVSEDSCIESSLSFRNIKPYTNEIVLFIGANRHKTDITIQVDNITFIVLPIIGTLVPYRTKFTRVRVENNALIFGSDSNHVSTRINLVDKKTIALTFLFDVNRDYSLTGIIAFPKANTIRIGALQSNNQNYPHFHVWEEQNFFVTISSGESYYYLHKLHPSKGIPLFYLAYRSTRKIEGPEIVKKEYGTFAIRIKQPINLIQIQRNERENQLNLAFQTNATHLQFKSFSINQTINIEGFYHFTKMNLPCVYAIMGAKIKLNLEEVTEVKSLLEDNTFLTMLSSQGLNQVSFYDSLHQNGTELIYDETTKKLQYKGFTYLLDPIFGLIVKKSGILTEKIANNVTEISIEDFSNSLSQIIDVRSNYNLPLLIDNNLVHFGERILKLPALAKLLINSGDVVPLSYLPRSYRLTLFFLPLSTSNAKGAFRQKRHIENLPIRKERIKQKTNLIQISKHMNYKDNVLPFFPVPMLTYSKRTIVKENQELFEPSTQGFTCVFNLFSILLFYKKKLKLPCRKIYPTTTQANLNSLSMEIYDKLKNMIENVAKKLKLDKPLLGANAFEFEFYQKIARLLTADKPIELIALIQEEVESLPLIQKQKNRLLKNMIPLAEQMENQFNLCMLKKASLKL